MRRLDVRNPVPYPVLIGEGALKEAPPPSGPAALLFDRKVAGFAEEVAEALGVRARLGVEGGEGAKSLEVYGEVLSWLAGEGLPGTPPSSWWGAGPSPTSGASWPPPT